MLEMSCLPLTPATGSSAGEAGKHDLGLTQPQNQCVEDCGQAGSLENL